MFLVASNVRTNIAPPIFQEIFQVHFCCQFQGVSTFKTWKTWTSLWTLGLETIFPTMYLLLLNLASASDLGLGRHQALLLATFNMESSLFMCCWSMMDRWGDGVKIPNNHIFKDVVFFLGKDGLYRYTLENFNSWKRKKNRGLDEDVFFLQMGDFEVPRRFSACNRVVDFPYVLSSQSQEFSGCVMMCPWQPTLWHVLTKLCCGKWGPEIHQRAVHTILMAGQPTPP